LEEAEAELKIALANNLAAAKTATALAEQELPEAEGRLKMLLAGSRAEEIEAVQAEITRLEARRDHLTQQLTRLTVRSPIAGVITTRKLREKVGEFVDRGDLIATVHELNTISAEIAVPEKEIADVRIGQNVWLKARAYPEQIFEGRVISIAPAVTQSKISDGAAEETGLRPRTVLVTTQIRNEAGLLKGAMTGQAKIYCGSRRVSDLLTRRATRYLRVEFWSWW
jgi:multidrug resistance efflux pump